MQKNKLTMLYDSLDKYRILLGSQSPRRHQFLRDLQINFEVLISDIEESFPANLGETEITDFLAKKKADSLLHKLKENDILITSDTIVCYEKQVLGKPNDIQQAKEMLQLLSGKTHKVVSSVAFTTTKQQIIENDQTEVTFKKLTNKEIDYYIKHYHPLDKAGAYGIQEWLGFIAVIKIKGSYNNVIGMPTHLVYKTLSKLMNK